MPASPDCFVFSQNGYYVQIYLSTMTTLTMSPTGILADDTASLVYDSSYIKSPLSTSFSSPKLAPGGATPSDDNTLLVAHLTQIEDAGLKTKSPFQAGGTAKSRGIDSLVT